jgi:hypothetical protein
VTLGHRCSESIRNTANFLTYNDLQEASRTDYHKRFERVLSELDTIGVAARHAIEMNWFRSTKAFIGL